jgi:hypothetical protein
VDDKKYTLLDFNIALIEQLANDNEDEPEVKGEICASHTPVRVKDADRRTCKHCTNRNCSFKCFQCQEFACVDFESDDITSSCFYRHSSGL